MFMEKGRVAMGAAVGGLCVVGCNKFLITTIFNFSLFEIREWSSMSIV